MYTSQFAAAENHRTQNGLRMLLKQPSPLQADHRDHSNEVASKSDKV